MAHIAMVRHPAPSTLQDRLMMRYGRETAGKKRGAVEQAEISSSEQTDATGQGLRTQTHLVPNKVSIR